MNHIPNSLLTAIKYLFLYSLNSRCVKSNCRSKLHYCQCPFYFIIDSNKDVIKINILFEIYSPRPAEPAKIVFPTFSVLWRIGPNLVKSM